MLDAKLKVLHNLVSLLLTNKAIRGEVLKDAWQNKFFNK